MGSRGFLDVMVEGGPTLAAAFLSAGLVDTVVMYLGSKLAGGTGFPALAGGWATLSDAIDLVGVDVELLDGDVKITAEVAG
jgi:diaminohydroxyphosphoribosylaminopyrimidine deaminase/5-amino-6-(5-phosphoribosylamino)uracil reductase